MYYFHLYAVSTVEGFEWSGVGKESVIQYAWAC